MKTTRSDYLSHIKKSLVAALAVLILSPLLPACSYIRTKPGLPTLSSIDEILKLSSAEASRGYPVRLRAAVTYYDPEWHVLFVQDSTAGMYVNTSGRELNIQSGQMVEITASTGNKNELADPQIQSLGPTLMPSAKDATLKQAAAGGDLLNQWIRVTGTVRAADMHYGRVLLRIVGNGGQLRAILLNTKDVNPLGLIDARISVEGVCGSRHNERGEMDGPPTLLVTNYAQITMQEQPVADPFSMVTTSVGSILNSTPENYPLHRVRLKGTVLEQKDGGLVLIKDDTGQIWVHAEQVTSVEPGADVDVVGFADLSDSTHTLQQAIVHPARSSSSTEALTQQHPEMLTSVAQVRRLTPEEASESTAVQIRGVVSYTDPAWGLLFVQDSTGGIYVDTHGQQLPLQAGDVVQVDGISSPGDFAPIISRPQVRVLGKGKMPVPSLLAAARLISGKEDSQYIETTGVVRSLSQDPTHLFLNIDADGMILKAQIPNFAQAIPSELIDSEVNVRAVCGTIFNKMRQLIGVQLFISNLNDIVVERATHDDPFSAPVRSVNTLLRFVRPLRAWWNW